LDSEVSFGFGRSRRCRCRFCFRHIVYNIYRNLFIVGISSRL
jgi:hypothetical protein